MQSLTFKLLALITLGSCSIAAAQCPHGCSRDQDYYDPCSPDPSCIEMYDLDYQLYGDFLWWQIGMSGLEFALLGGTEDDPQLEVNERGCVMSPKCHFEPGFRVGMILNPCGSCWDVFGQYTYMYTNVSTDAELAFGVPGLKPLIFTLAYAGNDINYARGELQTHFNVFDFGLRKTYSCDYCFDFHPHLGIKATWQEFDTIVTYREFETTSILSQSSQQFHTNFDGVGLRGGLDSDWRFSHCFSIVGGFSLSTIFSNICSTRTDTFTGDINETSPSETINVSLKQELCVLVPVIELNFGLRFNQHVCGCYDVFAYAGWETQIWMDLNKNLYIANGSVQEQNNIQFGPHGSVIYQGLTARLGIGF